MPKWEYKSFVYKPKDSIWTEKDKNEEKYIQELNKLGEDGWELVDILHYASGVLVSFILKRQVNE